jgi:polyhydroxybutyrate depolymerase
MIRHVALLALAALACTPERAPAGYPAGYSVAPPSTGAPSTSTSTGAQSTSTSAPGCGKVPAKAGGLVGQHVTAAGRDRTYTLVIPEGYAPQTPYPLVFVLHGGGGTAAGARTQTDLEKVAAGQALFVYPESIGGNWDLNAPAQSNGDVALFDAISLVVFNSLCVDSRRLFVTGFSNGAYMANQLACKRGERIRGIVTHAGGGPYENPGTYDAQGHLVCPGKAVASLVVHGNNDGTVAPSEGQKSIDHWSQANRCSSGTTSTLVAPCVALEGCFQPVGVCRIPGLGHGLWKEAGKVTWAFFTSLR